MKDTHDLHTDQPLSWWLRFRLKLLGVKVMCHTPEEAESDKRMKVTSSKKVPRPSKIRTMHSPPKVKDD